MNTVQLRWLIVLLAGTTTHVRGAQNAGYRALGIEDDDAYSDNNVDHYRDYGLGMEQNQLQDSNRVRAAGYRGGYGSNLGLHSVEPKAISYEIPQKYKSSGSWSSGSESHETYRKNSPEWKEPETLTMVVPEPEPSWEAPTYQKQTRAPKWEPPTYQKQTRAPKWEPPTYKEQIRAPKWEPPTYQKQIHAPKWDAY